MKGRSVQVVCELGTSATSCALGVCDIGLYTVDVDHASYRNDTSTIHRCKFRPKRSILLS